MWLGFLLLLFQGGIKTKEGQTKARQKACQAWERRREANHCPFRAQRQECSGKHRNENTCVSATPGISPRKSGFTTVIPTPSLLMVDGTFLKVLLAVCTRWLQQEPLDFEDKQQSWRATERPFFGHSWWWAKLALSTSMKILATHKL